MMSQDLSLIAVKKVNCAELLPQKENSADSKFECHALGKFSLAFFLFVWVCLKRPDILIGTGVRLHENV